jgi:hypothetical protein
MAAAQAVLDDLGAQCDKLSRSDAGVQAANAHCALEHARLATAQGGHDNALV